MPRNRFLSSGRLSLGYIKAIAVTVSVAALVASTCSEEAVEITVAPELKASKTEIPAAGGSQFISVTVAGAWTLSAAAPDGGDADWLQINPASGEGSTGSVVLKAAANTGEESRSAVLTLAVAGEDAPVTAILIQKGTTAPEPDPEPEPEPRKYGWLELPAISSGAAVYKHSMTLGTTVTRNYTFQWNSSALVADWVAYPLSSWNISSGYRTEEWALDPLLPEESQPVLYRGFGVGTDGNRYDRGHQCPSADRLSYSGNVQTFYGTNMTPQMNSFNAYIWANLESKVRSWAKSSDTCYVVTGCVTEGSTVYAPDNMGKKVTVPVRYYKAVLRYSRSSTLGFSGYMGCAILLDHKGYGNSAITSSMGMSIDELEEKLGMDFFVNLPDAIGEEEAAKVEAQDPKTISWWW